MEQLLFGTAYYDEYMPCERLDKDVEMMKAAGINVVRIAESTWSTCEPQEGVFDFSHVERVLDAMERAGISVIVGTPTYAVPTWMVKSYPEVLATTVRGRGLYGPRQIMDITNPVYLFYAERVIRRLMECTAGRACVIGFQIDNETKYYGTAGKNVQEGFVKYLRAKFGDDLDALNRAFGLDYWSNRINAWEDFPDVRGTINGSLGAEFEKYQRTLVDRFLSWQASIVREYARDGQFITHNFDFGWKGHSYGVQPEVNHRHASECLTVAGVDIYHPTQDDLTGEEIAFGGDLIRSLKHDNYLVIETEAQGFPSWTPYRGQLRLQAYSHLASGANSVMYWHWHSLHNGCETYWKGILSHDFEENEVYREVAVIGKEFARLGGRLADLKKKNRIALLVSNEALTALKWFPIGTSKECPEQVDYNDVVRWIYDRLYRMNAECDIIFPEEEHLESYDLIAVPALYAAEDSLLERLNEYTAQGGTLLATSKTGFTDEHVKVSTEVQPHILCESMGVSYSQFTYPRDTWISGETFRLPREERRARVFMELLQPREGTQVLASYEHYNWEPYAAVTSHAWGRGTAVYVGCMTSDALLDEILRYTLEKAGLAGTLEQASFPVIVRGGVNRYGRAVRYYLNYSAQEQRIEYAHGAGTELLSETRAAQGKTLVLGPWEVKIVEEDEVL